MTKPRALAVLLFALPFLLAGCGGGGVSTSSATTVLAPKTLVGGVLLANYPDGRAFTFTISSSAANGVTRSDGKVSTNWIGTGYGTGIMSLQVAYGAFTAGSLNNVFDDYTLTFTSKDAGVLQIRENTTSATYSSSTILTGNFMFTTYPPNG
ncbi:MAG: hypothetical protein JWM88_2398 [Verrucomicrobia bacterium]|nr:hypothetical protein [Verrucomicrobiota bacterium]